MAHISVFEAVADPTRRRIVESLRGGEQQVNDVVTRLDINQSGVSRHLRILLDAGFVRVRADGQRRLYSLRPEPFHELEAWVASYRSLWDARLERFGEAVDKKRRTSAIGYKGKNMTNEMSTPVRTPIKFERRYDAPVEDLWELWTTKDGFESWWGPAGFRVEVHAINPTAGGELSYDMIAVGAEEIEHMKKMGMALSHGTRGTFVEVEPHDRLKIRHTIDFIPGLRPYDNDILVEFVSEGSGVRMLVTLEQHLDEEWTRRAAAGFESQLTKLPKALAARRK